MFSEVLVLIYISLIIEQNNNNKKDRSSVQSLSSLLLEKGR
jgi:hypothetical protein